MRHIQMTLVLQDWYPAATVLGVTTQKTSNWTLIL